MLSILFSIPTHPLAQELFPPEADVTVNPLLLVHSRTCPRLISQAESQLSPLEMRVNSETTYEIILGFSFYVLVSKEVAPDVSALLPHVLETGFPLLPVECTSGNVQPRNILSCA